MTCVKYLPRKRLHLQNWNFLLWRGWNVAGPGPSYNRSWAIFSLLNSYLLPAPPRRWDNRCHVGGLVSFEGEGYFPITQARGSPQLALSCGQLFSYFLPFFSPLRYFVSVFIFYLFVFVVVVCELVSQRKICLQA